MGAATVSRWSRAFVAVGATFFVAWNVAVLLELPRATGVALGLYGFVFSVVFGKGYALVPAYFARELAVPRAPTVHLPLAVVGVLGLASAGAGGGTLAATVGAVAWVLGVAVFVGTLGWTVRDNPTGHETGTTEVNVHRVAVDRVANAAVPVVLAYLLAAALLRVAAASGASPLGPPAVSHVLAAGGAALLVFAVGFRLLPRFLVVSPSPIAVRVVLLAGAVGPAVLVTDFLGGRQFQAGAVLIAAAIVGFALAFLDMYRRTDRDRVGFHGVALGGALGALAVALGLSFASGHLEAPLVAAHYRLAVGGFLGLTIVGVSYQFYPPAIAATPGIGDRTALASILAIGGGLALEAAALATGATPIVRLGSLLALAGACAYATTVLVLFLERWRDRR